jgi:hypothetical protein
MIEGQSVELRPGLDPTLLSSEPRHRNICDANNHSHFGIGFVLANVPILYSFLGQPEFFEAISSHSHQLTGNPINLTTRITIIILLSSEK